jgi:hypothetical protein
MPALSSRNRLADGLLSAGSLSVLVAGMAALDKGFRVELLSVLNGGSSSTFAPTGFQLQRMVQLVVDTVRDFGATYTPLVLFGAVAAALLLLMLRP